MEPQERRQIGAHYTSREDIETLLQAVVMEPLRREWAEVRQKADKLWEKIGRAFQPDSGEERPSGQAGKPDLRQTER